MILRPDQIEAMRAPSRAFRGDMREVIARQGGNAAIDPASGDLVVREADQGTTRMAFGRNGLPSSVRAPDGRVRHFEYDTRGRPCVVKDLAGNATILRYNDDNQVVRVTDPAGYFEEIVYDKGLPVEVKGPKERNLRFAYDRDGILSRMIDGRGNEVGLHFGDDGLLDRATDRCGASTGYSYDDRARLSGIVTPTGNAWRFEQDDRLNERSVVYPDGKRDRFRYSGPWLNGTERRDGSEVRLKAQSDGRMTEVLYPGGIKVELAYDSDGHIVRVDNGRHKVAFSYDQEGRRVSEDLDGRRVELRFAEDGLLSEIVTHRGDKVAFAYGPDQQVNRVTDWNGRTYDIRRDARGFVTRIAFPNGTVASRQFSPEGLLQADRLVTGEGAISREYRYDANHMPVRVADSVLGAKEHVFDAEDRLVGVKSPHGRVSYAYDANGNIVRIGDRTLRYDALDRIASDSDAPCRHDELGNLVEVTGSGGLLRCGYNGQSQLVRVDLPGGGVAEYEYDGFGRRVAKRVDGIRTTYTWWGEQIVAEDTDGPDARRVDYLYLPGTNAPLAMRVDGRVYFYHTDHLDTPVRLTDEAGRIVWCAESRGYDFVQFENVVRQPLRFPGHYRDEETGLHYNVTRYYHPALGRYLTPDPAFFEDQTNLYPYARCNPTAFVDPTGRLPVLLGLAAGLLVPTAAGAAIGAGFGAVHRVASNMAQGRSWSDGVREAAGRGSIAGAAAGLGAGIGFLVGGPVGAVVGGFIGGTAASMTMAAIEAEKGRKGEACVDAAVGSIPFVGSVERFVKGDPTVKNPKTQLTVDLAFDIVCVGLMFFGLRKAQTWGKKPAEAKSPEPAKAVAPKEVEGAENALKPGDVMKYKDYLARREKGSTLRGHHVPQARRLEEVGIDPAEGTVVVMENVRHTTTRTFGSRGRSTAATEKGQQLSASEALDLRDPSVSEMGTDVAERIRAMNRQNHEEQFK